MSAPSYTNDITAIKNGLVTLMQAFTNPNWGGSVTSSRTVSALGITNTLPFVWVRGAGEMVSRTEISADTFWDVRVFYLACYVSQVKTISNTNDVTDVNTALDNAGNWINPMHKYLADNRNSVCEGTEIVLPQVRDSGVLETLREDFTQTLYAGIVFTVPVQVYSFY